VPPPTVISTRPENIGRIRNKGADLSLAGHVPQRTDCTMSADFVSSHDKNTAVDLGPGRTFIPTSLAIGQGQSTQYTQRIVAGEPLGTFFGPVFAGWGPNGVQLFNHYTVTRDANGNITSRVLAGTVPSTGIAGDDYVVLGNANPKYGLGLHTNGSWKAFD